MRALLATTALALIAWAAPAQAGISVNKSFDPALVFAGETATATVAVNNDTVDIDALNVSFTDVLPAGLIVATPSAAAIACFDGFGNAAPSTGVLVASGDRIALSGETVPARRLGAGGGEGRCVVSVLVTSNIPDTFTNSIGAGEVTSDNVGANPSATDVSLLVLPPVSGEKRFSPSAVARGGTSTLLITLRNASSRSADIVSFLDDLNRMGAPGDFVIASTPVAVTNCTSNPAQLSAIPGSGAIALSGGTIAANGSCFIRVPVTVAPSAALGTAVNEVRDSEFVTSLGSGGTFSDSLEVLPPATVQKAFSPTTIGPGQTTRLTITLTHLDSAPAFTSLGVTDDLGTMGAGFTVAASPSATNTCGGTFAPVSGATLLTLSGGFLPEGLSSCQLSVNITAPSGTGTNTNTIPANALTNDQNLGNPAPATAALNRNSPPNLQMSKAFSPSTIAGGQASTLNIIFNNTASGAVTLTNADFTDNFPTGMQVYSPANATFANVISGGAACTAEVIDASPGSGLVALRNARIPAASACRLQVQVTGVRDGNLINTVPNNVLTSAQGVSNVNGTPVSATLTITQNLNLIKGFSPRRIGTGDVSTLTITVVNSSNTSTAGNAVAFRDNLPTGVSVAAGPILTTCSGGVVNNASGLPLAVGDTNVVLSGGAFNAQSTCSVMVPVTAATGGSYLNTIPVGNLSTADGRSNSQATSDTLLVLQKPSIAKAFSPNPIGVGARSTLTFTLTNSNSNTVLPGGLTNVSFSDTLNNMRIALPGPAGGTCPGASNNQFAANATQLNFAGITVANGSCTVTVRVTSDTPGSHPNTVSGPTSNQTPTPGDPANATLRVLARPTVSKQFTPSRVLRGENASLAITITNPNPLDLTLTSTGLIDHLPSSPSPIMVVNAITAATTCVGASLTDEFGGPLVDGATSIQVSGGTVPANGSCVVQVEVTANALGEYINETEPVQTTEAGASLLGAQARLTVFEGASLAGYVYRDDNVNGSREADEAWVAGQNVRVNLVRAGAVVQSILVPTGGGYYQFNGVTPGSYRVVVHANSATAVTPQAPGDFRFVNPSAGEHLVSMGSAPGLLYNFGLINAPQFSGVVFLDTGSPSGTANDQLQQAGERGLGGVPVTLTDCGATTYTTTLTAADGRFSLMPTTLPAPGPGVRLCVQIPQPMTGHTRVGANVNATVLASGVPTSVGGTNYTYRPSPDSRERIAIDFAAGGSRSEIHFAQVPLNRLEPDNVATATPGTVIFHAHRYEAGTAGQLTISLSAVANPAIPGWSEAVIRDAGCDGQLTSGQDLPVTAPVALTAAQAFCFLVREAVPAGAPQGAQNLVTVNTTFTYANAPALAPLMLMRSDLTTVGAAAASTLQLVKTVDAPTAGPGTVLTYTLQYINRSAESLSQLSIQDSVPSYTNYVGGSAQCVTPLPASLVSCTVSVAPADGQAGALEWSLGGALQSGAEGRVRFQVRVMP